VEWIYSGRHYESRGMEELGAMYMRELESLVGPLHTAGKERGGVHPFRLRFICRDRLPGA
jgi:hypothetical protein